MSGDVTDLGPLVEDELEGAPGWRSAPVCEWMWFTAEELVEESKHTSRLLKWDVVLPPERIEDVDLDQVDEGHQRESAAALESDDRFEVPLTDGPGADGRLRHPEILGHFGDAVGRHFPRLEAVRRCKTQRAQIALLPLWLGIGPLIDESVPAQGC